MRSLGTQQIPKPYGKFDRVSRSLQFRAKKGAPSLQGRTGSVFELTNLQPKGLTC
jgi:hypothetical protein